ncbi:MAG: exodeoxyribonuclease VII small subunit [Candidatus Omnitrophota bacterium]|nr:exodeoxyribonuclease VII small subunit [Candidatus Omnitrophota bacterium]
MAEEIVFEKALERLEKIVEDLESGEVKLEDALKRFEEGVKLAHACQTKLVQAEKKIEVLNRSLDGSFTKEPFNLEDEEEAKKPAAKKSR